MMKRGAGETKYTHMYHLRKSYTQQDKLTRNREEEWKNRPEKAIDYQDIYYHGTQTTPSHILRIGRRRTGISTLCKTAQ
jgi:hypothetical protein